LEGILVEIAATRDHFLLAYSRLQSTLHGMHCEVGGIKIHIVSQHQRCKYFTHLISIFDIASLYLKGSRAEGIGPLNTAFFEGCAESSFGNFAQHLRPKVQ
jgi:hypothetical protein